MGEGHSSDRSGGHTSPASRVYTRYVPPGRNVPLWERTTQGGPLVP